MARILVVDDSEIQRTQLRKDLEGAGHQVLEASNGVEGLAKLRQDPGIELVICDVNMPEMDGLAMCQKIKEGGQHPQLPIFMLTTEVLPELKQRGQAAGVRAWIAKPFALEKLLKAVEKVVPPKG